MAEPVFQVLNSKAWGGLEMFGAELAESLTLEVNASVLTLAPKDSLLAQHCEEKKLPWLSAQQKFDQILALRYWSKCHPEGPVIVQILRDLKWVRWALINRRNPLVGFAHMMVGVNKKDPLHEWIYGRLNRLICFSPEQKQNLLEHLPLSESQVLVIPHGVDLKRFRPRPLNSTEQNGGLIVGVVGRLDPQKGQRDLLEAMGLLKSEGVSAQIHFVGGETENEQGEAHHLIERAFELGLSDQLSILPFRKDIEEAYQHIDILVMPSHRETFGRVLIEGMASGLACVATRAGGVPSIMSDQNEGLLVEPQNPVALASALRRLLSNSIERQKFGQNARARVERDFNRQFQQRLFHDAIFGKKGLQETGLP